MLYDPTERIAHGDSFIRFWHGMPQDEFNSRFAFLVSDEDGGIYTNLGSLDENILRAFLVGYLKHIGAYDDPTIKEVDCG